MYLSTSTTNSRQSAIIELNNYQLAAIRGGAENGNQIVATDPNPIIDLTKPPVVIDPVTGKPIVPKK